MADIFDKHSNIAWSSLVVLFLGALHLAEREREDEKKIKRENTTKKIFPKNYIRCNSDRQAAGSEAYTHMLLFWIHLEILISNKKIDMNSSPKCSMARSKERKKVEEKTFLKIDATFNQLEQTDNMPYVTFEISPELLH